MSLFPLKPNTWDIAQYHNAFFLQPFAALETLNPFPHLGSCCAQKYALQMTKIIIIHILVVAFS